MRTIVKKSIHIITALSLLSLILATAVSIPARAAEESIDSEIVDGFGVEDVGEEECEDAECIIHNYGYPSPAGDRPYQAYCSEHNSSVHWLQTYIVKCTNSGCGTYYYTTVCLGAV